MRLTGIDLAEGMLAVAREHAAATSTPPNFRIGDAIAPDFPPQSFDVATPRAMRWSVTVIDRRIDIFSNFDS